MQTVNDATLTARAAVAAIQGAARAEMAQLVEALHKLTSERDALYSIVQRLTTRGTDLAFYVDARNVLDSVRAPEIDTYHARDVLGDDAARAAEDDEDAPDSEQDEGLAQPWKRLA